MSEGPHLPPPIPRATQFLLFSLRHGIKFSTSIQTSIVGFCRHLLVSVFSFTACLYLRRNSLKQESNITHLLIVLLFCALCVYGIHQSPHACTNSSCHRQHATRSLVLAHGILAFLACVLFVSL